MKEKLLIHWPQGLRWRHDLLDSSFLDADAESSTDERRRARDASSLSGHGCEATRAGTTLRTEWSKDSEGVVSSGGCADGGPTWNGWKQSCLANSCVASKAASHHGSALHSHSPFMPHWRTTPDASGTQQTKKHGTGELHVTRAHSEMSKAFPLVVSSQRN